MLFPWPAQHLFLSSCSSLTSFCVKLWSSSIVMILMSNAGGFSLHQKITKYKVTNLLINRPISFSKY
jgi:hypothetical protein